MTSSQRVLVNAIAQYSRTIVNMTLSLYTVRLVLASLGQSDYGLYSLIAGVVAMLSFITNSLVSTTQRFISFYQGKSDIQKLKEVFNNSLVIHIILGTILVLILVALTPLLFNGFLNIPVGRGQAAITIYYIVAIMLFISFINAPYRALLISHENIVYISVIDVLDAIIKVVLVIIMTYSDCDKLIFYTFIMLGVQFFNLCALSMYCFAKYKECTRPNICRLNIIYVKDLSKYAGWNIYGTLCITGRNQGIAILLNKIFGTVMNAAWGIGAQISGYTQFLSTAVVNAMSPQIVKAEGGGDRERTLFLSNILSKTNYFLMSMIGIPCIFEIGGILKLWLGNFPEETAFFAIIFIVAQLLDAMTIGLTHVNNAIGKIGLYTMVMCTPKLFTFIIAFLLMNLGLSISAVAIAYILIEGVCSLTRVPMISRQAGLNVRDFYLDVIIREILPTIVCALVCWGCVSFLEFPYRFLLTIFLSAFLYAVTFYFWGLTKVEKGIMHNLCHSIYSKILKSK